jgi:subtilisin
MFAMKTRYRFTLTLGLLALGACQPDSTMMSPDVETDPAFAAVGQELRPYIVVLRDGVSDVAGAADALVGPYGRRPDHVYEHALKGFAVQLPAGVDRAIARNPMVAFVEPDLPVSIAAQEVPTGIRRIFAHTNANIDIDGSDDLRVDVGVAIIDTGIDWEHPDLNVVDGIDCASRKGCRGNGDDNHYHGTHVAGTVAALDNGIGVVGVAPGARLYAVKVLDQRGSGYNSWIIAGINWVVARANEIQVANMSLGGSGSCSSSYQTAFNNAVAAGVAFAVAAGNDGANAANYSPASCNDILTVSALADFDGLPGGLGSSTCRSDQDDTLASFSNYGSVVDITAPGVCITSTYPLEKGEYATISGTSMASPHVAGGLALLASRNDPANASDVRALYNTLKNAGNLNWTDDSGDGVKERLLDVSGFQPTLIAANGGNTPPVASMASVSCALLTCSFDGSGSSDTQGPIASYAWTFGDGTTGSGATASHTYADYGEYTVTLTVTDGDGATGSTSETFTIADPTNVAPTATIVSVNCTDNACTFAGSGSDPDGSVASYAWSFGDGATASGASASHTYGASGTYTVTLTVTDDDGATGSTSQSVTVTIPAGQINFSYAFGKASKGYNAVRIDSFTGGSGTPGELRVTRGGSPVFSTDPFALGTVYSLGEKGGATYEMTVCDDTGACAAPVTIVF